MLSPNRHRLSPSEFLLVASMLLVATASLQVGSMPTRAGPEIVESTSARPSLQFPTWPSRAADILTNSTTESSWEQRQLGQSICAACDGEIQVRSSRDFVQLPCGHQLHLRCGELVRSLMTQYISICPRCQPSIQTEALRRFITNGRTRSNVLGDHVRDEVSPEEIARMFEERERRQFGQEAPLEMGDEQQVSIEASGEANATPTATATATDGGDPCPVCLGDIREPIGLECGHKFHKKCINSWFTHLARSRKHPSCPTCRHELQADLRF